jgi:uncharacterized protein
VGEAFFIYPATDQLRYHKFCGGVTTMAGTAKGGAKAAATNKTKYGADFYARIGAMGGKLGKSGGFASGQVGQDGLTGRERARIAGAAGGRISRRSKKNA